jgi:hypothetical protein
MDIWLPEADSMPRMLTFVIGKRRLLSRGLD